MKKWLRLACTGAVLAGALTVSERQEYSRRGAKSRDYHSRNARYRKSEYSLKKICRNRSHAGIKYLRRALFRHLSPCRLKGRCKKSKCKSMIRYKLKVGGAVSAEELRVEHFVARGKLIYARHQNENASAQNRRGYQGCLKKMYRLLQNICRK